MLYFQRNLKQYFLPRLGAAYLTYFYNNTTKKRQGGLRRARPLTWAAGKDIQMRVKVVCTRLVYFEY